MSPRHAGGSLIGSSGFDLYEHVREEGTGIAVVCIRRQIVSTLVHDPDLIVIDEPFAGLDPVNTRLIKDIFEEQREAGQGHRCRRTRCSRSRHCVTASF